MKLLSLNNYNYRRGGSDAVFLDHDALFRDLGWETALFSMQHPKNDQSAWTRYFVDELEFGHAYSWRQKLIMAGKVIYSFEARTKLAHLLDQFTPDIAHAHCIYHHISPSVLSLLHDRGVPTVMTAHDLKLACPAYKMLNRSGICERCKGGNVLNVARYRCVRDSFITSSLVAVETMTHRLLGLYRNNLDRIVAPSRFYGDKLVEWGWPCEKIAHIPNFIRAEEYVPQFQPGQYMLYFGRLAPEKGVATLIRAAVAAKIELRIAGTGPVEQQLRELAKPAGARIHFLGYQVGEALRTLVREAHMVVLPSEWYENAPVSVLEAYASGKPVIAARIGGIPEMVREGETGFLFQGGNTSELAELLTRAQHQPAAITELMGRQARDYVTQTFSISRYTEAMLSLYSGLGVRVRNSGDRTLHTTSTGSAHQ
jgi:glycosyltransferase involved in cell wall biosynthesis